MIFHLLPLGSWRTNPDAAYVPGTVGVTPFVHASPDEATMLAVANAFYRDAGEPLVVLALDETRLYAPLKWEAADPSPPPHVYGPLERAAVTSVRYLRADAAGRFAGFSLPVSRDA
jgi:uncharacterized protein (DUF952 family)